MTAVRRSPTNHWISEEIRRERAEERIRQHKENAERGDVRMCARDLHDMYEGEIRFTPDGHVRCWQCKAASDAKPDLRAMRLAANKARTAQALEHLVADKQVREAMETWHKEGSCRMPAVVDPELFFPVDGEKGRTAWRRAQAAKAVCAQCPVMQQCRDFGLETRQQFGVWGGLTREDRNQIWAAELGASA